MEIQVPKKINISRSFLLTVGVILAVTVSFYGGVRYQKHHQPLPATTTNNGSGVSPFGGAFGGGRRFAGLRGIRGSVTAISASSISVQNAATNASQTFAITSTTRIMNNGQTAQPTDIKVGDHVVIIPSSTNAAQAAQIRINPNFGSNAPASGASST